MSTGVVPEIRRIAAAAAFVLPAGFAVLLPAALTALTALAAPIAAQDASAQAAAVPTVAVLDFSGISLSPGEDAAAVGASLAGMITTELAERPEVRVVDRQRIQELIQRRQLNLSGRVDDAQAMRLGQLLGAQYIVVGQVTLDPKRARLDIRLLDVSTGAIERAAKEQGSRDEFLDIVDRIANAFTADLKLPVVAGPAPAAPADAILAYSRGLDYERRGMRDRAAEMFRKALELFPRHAGAAEALERVGG